jgi:AcrR family transcriptional regulator
VPKDHTLQRQILNASIDLLQKGGVGALSMREVARRAGVSHQAPYHHFPDREAILAAIAEEGFTGLADALHRARDGAATIAERLKSTGLSYVEFALSHPAHFRVMFRPELVDMAAFPSAQAEGLRAYGELQEIVRALLAEVDGLHGGEVVWTRLTWSLVHGLACLLLDGPIGLAIPTRKERRAVVEEALDALVETLGAEDRGGRPRGARRSVR